MQADLVHLDEAINRRIAVENEFVRIMRQEFQQIQRDLEECVRRHPQDRQLAKLRTNLRQFGVRSHMPFIPTPTHRPLYTGTFTGKGRKTRKCSH